MSSATLFGLCAPRLSITTIRPSFRLGASAFLQGLVFDLSSERLHDPGRPGKCVACSFPFSALLVQLPRLRPYLPQLTRQADLLRQGPGLTQARQRLPGLAVPAVEHREHPQVDQAKPAVSSHPLPETLYVLAGQLLASAPQQSLGLVIPGE